MHGDLERKTNQAEAKAMAEEEQERRISADKAEGLEKRPSFVVEKGVLADLKPDEAPALKPTPSKAEVSSRPPSVGPMDCRTRGANARRIASHRPAFHAPPS